MRVSERTYEEIVLANPGRKLELHRGRVREKPAMTMGHNRVMWRLIGQLTLQLDYDRYDLRGDSGRVRRGDETYYIPDVYVILIPRNRPLSEKDNVWEIAEEPLPFVAEVWSPSTGDYDVEEKIPEYKRRGDLEIWRLHPTERTLTAWRRQSDGGYAETVHRGGKVELAALPGVVVDLDELFA
jgi:Uma2 family endonuclease